MLSLVVKSDEGIEPTLPPNYSLGVLPLRPLGPVAAQP